MAQEQNKIHPETTLARSFSATLNDVFALGSQPGEGQKATQGASNGDVESSLAQSIEQKKQAVSSQSKELEALEARLREAEDRLKQKQLLPEDRRSGPSRMASAGRRSPHRRTPLGNTFEEAQADDGAEASEQALDGLAEASGQVEDSRESTRSGGDAATPAIEENVPGGFPS